MLRRALALVAVAAGLVLLPGGPPAHAVTDTWAGWGPVTGTSNDYATTMQQRSPGFPRATVATDSRANVQLAGGTSTFLGPGTPPGAKYGSSRGSSYLVLRPKADTPTGASTTTYSFDHPTPEIGWAFVLGDVDADAVRVTATGADGRPVPDAEVASWFRSTFNYAGGADVPRWDALTATLTGNPGAVDTDGASAWFEPDVRLTSLTFTFTRRAGFPVYQTWFVSRARPIGGRVVDVSDDPAACPVEQSVLTLVSPSGERLATTSPGADGTYSFGELATQTGYTVRLSAPDTCAVTGAAQVAVANVGEDGDDGSRANFTVREIVPQPISGFVRSGSGTGPAVAGVTVTLTRPDGSTATTTTGPDGAYLFDENERDEGYSVSIEVPDGYAAGAGGTEIDGIVVDDERVALRPFVVQPLPAVTGTVTGGGGPIGGVTVTLTPDGGGPALSTVTTGDGGYAFTGVPEGGYTVAVTPPAGYAGDTTEPVTVTTADEVVDFALTRPGAVGGTVTDEDGGPAAGVEVVVDGPGPPVTVVTDDAGRYFVDELAPGRYDVRPVPPAGTATEAPASRTTTVTAAGEIRGGLDFVLARDDDPDPTDPPTSEPPGPPPPSTPPGVGDGAGGSTGTGSTLPDTGGPARGWFALGGALVLAGAGLLVHGRRRAEG